MKKGRVCQGMQKGEPGNEAESFTGSPLSKKACG